MKENNKNIMLAEKILEACNEFGCSLAELSDGQKKKIRDEIAKFEPTNLIDKTIEEYTLNRYLKRDGLTEEELDLLAKADQVCGFLFDFIECLVDTTRFEINVHELLDLSHKKCEFLAESKAPDSDLKMEKKLCKKYYFYLILAFFSRSGITMYAYPLYFGFCRAFLGYYNLDDPADYEGLERYMKEAEEQIMRLALKCEDEGIKCEALLHLIFLDDSNK